MLARRPGRCLNSGMRACLVLVLAACSTTSTPPPAVPGPDVPSSEVRWREGDPCAGAPAARACAAIDELQATLGKRLKEVMAAGGPPAAMSVCSAEAQAMTRDIATRTGVEVGRTSERLRNPENAPRAWVRPYLERNRGRRGADVIPASIELPGRVGVVRPIAVQPMCLACHGDPAAIAPEVKAVLAARYPADAATGYAEGDLRGVFWAEAKEP